MAALFCSGGGETATPATNAAKERFRLFSPHVSGNSSPEIFVIDTETGRIWKQNFFAGRDVYLVPQPYLSADGSTASATPSESISGESLSLQKRYEKQLERTRAESPERK